MKLATSLAGEVNDGTYRQSDEASLLDTVALTTYVALTTSEHCSDM
jgi:hypothetical protein